jgi:ATP synthase protein I
VSEEPRSEFTNRRRKKRVWSKKKSQMRQARTWLDVSVVGIQFPVAIALGFFFGRWLDTQLNTWPYLTGLFCLFGIIAGFVNLFRITAAAARAEETEARLRTEAEARGEILDEDNGE